jgi:hypothetical protein
MTFTINNRAIVGVRPRVRPTPTPTPTSSSLNAALLFTFSTFVWQKKRAVFHEIGAFLTQQRILITDSGIGKLVARIYTYQHTTLGLVIGRKSPGAKSSQNIPIWGQFQLGSHFLCLNAFTSVLRSICSHNQPIRDY